LRPRPRPAGRWPRLAAPGQACGRPSLDLERLSLC